MAKRNLTRHQDIYERVRARIVDGEFALGALLPAENQVCDAYCASRYAVREAFKRLEEEGMIARRRGHGTTVTSRSPVHTYRHGIRSLADLMNYATSTHMEWLDDDRISISGLLARHLGCDEGRIWQRLRGVRYEENGTILGLVEAYIDASIASVENIGDLNNGPVHRHIEKKFNLTTAALSQDIIAKQLSPYEAGLLRDQAGAATLRIIRRYTSMTGIVYMISVNTFRSRDFVYNLRMEFP